VRNFRAGTIVFIVEVGEAQKALHYAQFLDGCKILSQISPSIECVINNERNPRINPVPETLKHFCMAIILDFQEIPQFY
jgi:hypothetical protein